MEIELAKSIICKLYEGNIIYTDYELKKDISKYSNTKIPIPRFYINEKSVGRSNNIKIEYKCINCNELNNITLNLFVRKIQKNIIKCDKCKNNDTIKVKNQSEFMKQNAKLIIDKKYNKPQQIIKKRTINELIEIANDNFINMSDDFKKNYNNHNITLNEFNKIKHLIISFLNKKYDNLNDWEYINFWEINNQTKFVPMLYNQSNNIIEKICDIDIKCENCRNIYRCKTLNIYKNCYKILCRDCNFSNKTFKIRSTNNINGNPIRYQSRLEYDFIDFCNSNNFIILNGPKLSYIYINKNKTYLVDFYIPDFNMIIELKDNHIWHKKQVEKGIFDLKNMVANKYASENNLTFRVIFANEMNNFKNSLL
jgi:hypothetical protein